MVAAVRDDGRCLGDHQPHAHGANVGTHDHRTQHGRQGVGEDLLDGVGVDGDDADRGRPLMMLLVNVLVELGVVGQSARVTTTWFDNHKSTDAKTISMNPSYKRVTALTIQKVLCLHTPISALQFKHFSHDRQ